MDLIDIARYVSALMLVLALLGFAALAARRYGIPGVTAGSAVRRLAVVETLMIGPRHKIFLLRRDDREHLILVSPQGASVVENGIAIAAREAGTVIVAASEAASPEIAACESALVALEDAA